MANLTVPGVKIQEIASFPPSVAPVDTAVPAFIGYTEKGGTSIKKITSFLEFEKFFGGPSLATLNSIDVTLNSNNTAVDKVTNLSFTTPDFLLYYSVKAYYDNGGGEAYIASAKNYPTSGPVESELKAALDLVATEDEPTLIVIPDAINLSVTDHATLYQAALSQCGSLQDRFVIIDTSPNDSDADIEISDFRTNIGTSNLKYGAAYFPRLVTSYINNIDESIDPENINVTYHTSSSSPSGTLEDLMDLDPENTLVTLDGGAHPQLFLSSLVAAIQSSVLDAAKSFAPAVVIGPSGAIAGVYAKTDNNRGVWKAPANVNLNGVVDVTYRVDNNFQDDLNIDANSGKSVNAIRFFTGKGFMVWGGRTLAGNDNDWRYVNVRRLMIFIEESCNKASAQFVFESNTGQTWSRMKGMIESFLTNLWRQGALVGAKPDEAFFVRVGLGTTMTSDDILNGVMNVEIGVAPSRPAEFIILKFSHKVQVS